ncbi:FtsK/SpoIIIE domain-containing protein [Arthrobacter celericrescens]|uniref:FtsK/SpoIIIE domain-containing protein n=1 Tax=Arthrobacter celericrescens TaxID=2320851 RepID=UPI000EA3FC1B|nr:FtsK/SpoIIIE domain-containing protein [Arthrobacter celericrescens]
MPFHCTLVRGPLSPVRQGPVELTVEIDDGGPGSAVQAAVAGRFHTGELSVCGQPLSSLTVGRPPLVAGAVLVDRAADGPGPGPRARGPAVLHLLVHTGPGAGLVVPLERGSHSIGRGECTITVPDPEISRVHAVLTVSDTSVTLRDNGSSNGTRVDGNRVRAAVISTDSLIQCGTSLMTVVFDCSTRASALETAGSRTDEPLKIPRRAEATGRLNLLLMAGLPLLLGAALALATGTWTFLAFTGISAIAVLVPLAAGGKERRAFNAALRAAESMDRERREGAAPSAADIVFSVRTASSGAAGPDGQQGRISPSPSTDPVHPEKQAETGTSGGTALRIGTGEREARIVLDPPDPLFKAPVLRNSPVTLDPTIRDIPVTGPAASVTGLFNFLLMQLAVFPGALTAPILIHGAAGLLPLSARFLPRTTLCTNPDAALEAISTSTAKGFLFLQGPQAAPDVPLLEAADAAGWTVFRRSDGTGPEPVIDLGHGPAPVIDLGHPRAELRGAAGGLPFNPDLVAPEIFDSFCRLLGKESRETAGNRTGLPATCRLGDLIPVDVTSIRRRWEEAAECPGLPAVIGRGGPGVRTLDLVADGPHLLIAGTTGAGKSELLRTIVAALSLTHSPERVNFLFLDFKGGSGLGPLATLPHCVGLLTDLKRRGMDRTLVSLRAEVRRREHLLARAGVEDLGSYQLKARQGAPPGRRSGVRPLPRLVIVVDEFRMLIEDSPSALAELMRVATVGRSLGIHLIMATQRPQGAISSDIRANVTTSIALRVQSDMESRDVINSPLAAGIPISLPGRAYLSRGTEGCELFQAASMSGPAASTKGRAAIAREAVEALKLRKSGPEGGDADSRQRVRRPLDAGRSVVDAVCDAWSGAGKEQPLRPVAAELPESLRLDVPLDKAGGGSSIGRHARCLPPAGFLGVVDLPDKQCTGPLSWQPGVHGHLALLGPPGSGAESACLSIVSQLLSAHDEVHCYVLDGDASFPVEPLPGRVGALVTTQEPLRAGRVAERIAEEIAARQGKGAEGRVPLLFVITGWGSWLALLRAGPLAWVEDVIHGIGRDGATAGVHLLVTGDRELTTSRLYGSLPNRAFFPLGSTEESRAAWPRFAPLEPYPARAVACGPLLGEGLAEAQFAVPAEGRLWPYGTVPEPARPVFRVLPLPRMLAADNVVALSSQRASADRFGAHSQALLLGLGGDELEPVTLRLAPGGVALVLGHPGTGKSGLLDVLPALNPGIRWLRTAPGSDPGAFCARLHAQARAGSVDPRAVALIDDADRLGSEAAGLAAALPSLGVRVIATAAYSHSLLQRVPLATHALNEGRGILLSPRQPSDGDLFGIRLAAGRKTPGRAVLVQDGESLTFQIPVAGPPEALAA